jgi:metacaspase-1
VEDVADLLRSADHCGYLPEQVRVLRDGEARAASLKLALADFASTCGTDDTAVFVFSGHGERVVQGSRTVSYLCPLDFDPLNPGSTGISRDEFSGLLSAIPAKRLLVILDACHSAGSLVFKAGAVSLELKAGLSNGDFAALGTGAGRVLLASSREDEFSAILGGMRNSLFTYHLLEGLRRGASGGADGTIGVLDLFKYVSAAVRERSQHPVMKADNLEGNFPVALAAASPPVTAKSGGGRDPAWWLKLEQVAIRLYPTGPQEQEIWSRGGCSVAALKPNLNGRASWHAALRMLRLGGDGDPARLLSAMADDFPSNPELSELASYVPLT